MSLLNLMRASMVLFVCCAAYLSWFATQVWARSPGTGVLMIFLSAINLFHFTRMWRLIRQKPIDPGVE